MNFIVEATVITIVNYNCTVIRIVNYDRKTFIVQATGLMPVVHGIKHYRFRSKLVYL